MVEYVFVGRSTVPPERTIFGDALMILMREGIHWKQGRVGYNQVGRHDLEWQAPIHFVQTESLSPEVCEKIRKSGYLIYRG